MFTEEQLEKIIRNYIEALENPGQKSGGSGHLSHVSFNLDKIESAAHDKDCVKVKFEYLVSIETEFTYYPDNPPHTTRHRKTIILNSQKEIIEVVSSESFFEEGGFEIGELPDFDLC